jgi:hypothetical protein
MDCRFILVGLAVVASNRKKSEEETMNTRSLLGGVVAAPGISALSGPWLKPCFRVVAYSGVVS